MNNFIDPSQISNHTQPMRHSQWNLAVEFENRLPGFPRYIFADVHTQNVFLFVVHLDLIEAASCQPYT